MACVSTAVISLLLGFLIGFIFTKKCSSKDQSLKCGHANLEALMLERYVVILFVQYIISTTTTKSLWSSYVKPQYDDLTFCLFCRSSKDPNSIYESPYTTHTPSMTTKNNLLSNHPVKTDLQKNNLSVNSNTGTLGKCKKIYIWDDTWEMSVSAIEIVSLQAPQDYARILLILFILERWKKF